LILFVVSYSTRTFSCIVWKIWMLRHLYIFYNNYLKLIFIAEFVWTRRYFDTKNRRENKKYSFHVYYKFIWFLYFIKINLLFTTTTFDDKINVELLNEELIFLFYRNYFLLLGKSISYFFRLSYFFAFFRFTKHILNPYHI